MNACTNDEPCWAEWRAPEGTQPAVLNLTFTECNASGYLNPSPFSHQFASPRSFASEGSNVLVPSIVSGVRRRHARRSGRVRFGHVLPMRPHLPSQRYPFRPAVKEGDRSRGPGIRRASPDLTPGQPLWGSNQSCRRDRDAVTRETPFEAPVRYPQRSEPCRRIPF